MKIRGERECQDCGARFSYYETGAVTCPECGSIRSRGVGDRERHTDAAVALDLSEARSMAADGSLEAAADAAASACRDYLRQRGFIDAGELGDLDEAYLVAQELVHAAAIVQTRLSLDDAEERYVLALLEGADDGDRLAPDAVPKSMHAARGLGYATAVRDYRDDLRTVVDDGDRAVRSLLETLGEHVTRVRAIDGEVDPTMAESLVVAARAIGRAVRTGDEEALATARDALEDLR
ncbi:MAG: zinc ribbon domain-containing protein [Halanaeroarchaeum sp.]